VSGDATAPRRARGNPVGKLTAKTNAVKEVKKRAKEKTGIRMTRSCLKSHNRQAD
jgi:hypothetical protein